MPRRTPTRIAAAAAGILLAASLAACDRSGPAPVREGGGGPAFTVVAAENFWGSIAAQLAGGRASVHSVITDPGTDPHSYSPSSADARAIAGANLVIVNGSGYDEWASRMLDASPSPERSVIDVGSALKLSAGSNPHRWYYPADVIAVVRRIAGAYARLDPADASFFTARRARFETASLARYDRLRAQIAERYAGVSVGYSESIFQGLGESLHLRLLTPPSFARSIAEGTDVSAADKRAVDEQAARREIRVWVFNRQNVTPDVERVNALAAEHGIPVVPVTETLDPAGDTFQQWQSDQLQALLAALAGAPGR